MPQRENHEKRTNLYDKAMALENHPFYGPDHKETEQAWNDLAEHDYNQQPIHVCQSCGRMADDYESMQLSLHPETKKPYKDEETGELARVCVNCRNAHND
jgi:hypothetical protein